MAGVFKRRKLGSILCLLCGLFLIGLFLFFRFADSESTKGAYIGIALGGAITLFSIISLFFNYKAHFEIADGRILSKYHWFGKLDCNISDVAFADAQLNTLSILLRNGKRHVIMGIENSWPLASAIRRQIFSVEAESPDTLRQELASAQAARKKDLYQVIGGVALLFVNIFIAVLLTGGKETYDFSTRDWTVFAIMGAIEILIVIPLFYFADRCGKQLLPIQQLEYRLRGAIIATQPLPAGNVREVYTDENYFGRIAVCGFPNSEEVYYCVQEFTGRYSLETVQTSEIYPGADELIAEGLLDYIDITQQFEQTAE